MFDKKNFSFFGKIINSIISLFRNYNSIVFIKIFILSKLTLAIVSKVLPDFEIIINKESFIFLILIFFLY